jgi:hypothetical protein
MEPDQPVPLRNYVIVGLIGAAFAGLAWCALSYYPEHQSVKPIKDLPTLIERDIPREGLDSKLYQD